MICDFDQSYERGVIDLWNSTLPFDSVSIERFRKQILWDDNFDPHLTFVDVESDELVGFVWAVKRRFPYMDRGLEPDRGWINIVFVGSDFQGRGIGRSLIVEAQRRLRDQGASRITIAAYSPGYFFRGVDEGAYPKMASILDGLGYRRGEESYRMCRDLYGHTMPPKIAQRKRELEAEGFSIVEYDDSRSLELLEFTRSEFGGGWKRNCLMAMREGTAPQRVLLVLEPGGRICGFCTRAIDGNPMRFGPIGISQRYRDLGIGSVLLEEAMVAMERRGIHHMFFLSTDAPGRRFYERHGIRAIRTFVGYEKRFE